MKFISYILSSKTLSFFVYFVSLISLKVDLLNAEDLYFEEIQIDTSTKPEEDSSVIPTNPFEIVEMIKRNNFLNDATNPSDAIDDALELFNVLEEKEDN